MSRTNYIFLSHVLSSETPGYGGKVGFKTSKVKSIQEGDSCNQSLWELNNHIGTHIDAPFHFSSNGRPIHDFDANFWVFENVHLQELIVDRPELIDVDQWVERIPENCDLLLIKTGFEKYRSIDGRYWSDNPGLSANLGTWLRKNRTKMRVIGFDFISITSFAFREMGKVAHKAFLDNNLEGNPILAIEDMHLENLFTAPKKVYVSPLRVLGADGSPVTVTAEIGSH
ncbi:MAG: cyclase family protein [Bacteriovoracaceae bacterium]|nr:cyclase family protein [Bacteriovoracaceae bacterium]